MPSVAVSIRPSAEDMEMPCDLLQEQEEPLTQNTEELKSRSDALNGRVEATAHIISRVTALLKEEAEAESQDTEKVKTPYRILKNEAEMLTRMTGGRLTGVVECTVSHAEIATTLKVIVPTMNGYTFEVLRLWHDAEPYPVSLLAPWASRSPYLVKNQTDLEEELQRLVTPETIATAIRGLWLTIADE